MYAPKYTMHGLSGVKLDGMQKPQVSFFGRIFVAAKVDFQGLRYAQRFGKGLQPQGPRNRIFLANLTEKKPSSVYFCRQKQIITNHNPLGFGREKKRHETISSCSRRSSMNITVLYAGFVSTSTFRKPNISLNGIFKNVPQLFNARMEQRMNYSFSTVSVMVVKESQTTSQRIGWVRYHLTVLNILLPKYLHQLKTGHKQTYPNIQDMLHVFPRAK